MKPRLVELLVCPDCKGTLALTAASRDATEIVAGELRCRACARVFPITDGVPRFVGADLDDAERRRRRISAARGRHSTPSSRITNRSFRTGSRRSLPSSFGGGSSSRPAAARDGTRPRSRAGRERDVVGVDFSRAGDVAYRHTRELPNAHIVQAEIYRLPFRDCFDYVLSVGVLHHLPDPRAGFMRLVSHLGPGGAVSVWVYGRENNGWIVHVVNPLRHNVTSRLGRRPLYWMSLPLAAVLFAALRLLYRPLRRTRLRSLLPYNEYLTYTSGFPFHEIHSIVFDHLTAPIAFYLTRPEVESWFRDAGIDPEIAWHNENSWRGFGRVRAST